MIIFIREPPWETLAELFSTFLRDSSTISFSVLIRSAAALSCFPGETTLHLNAQNFHKPQFKSILSRMVDSRFAIRRLNLQPPPRRHQVVKVLSAKFSLFSFSLRIFRSWISFNAPHEAFFSQGNLLFTSAVGAGFYFYQNDAVAPSRWLFSPLTSLLQKKRKTFHKNKTSLSGGSWTVVSISCLRIVEMKKHPQNLAAKRGKKVFHVFRLVTTLSTLPYIWYIKMSFHRA